jgi:hypothetical protein
MAAAALIVAILALLVAGASAGYTRRAASSSARAVAIEEDRRLEERRPRFSAATRVHDASNEPYKGILTLTLESDEQLTDVRVVIAAGMGVSFNRNLYGVVPTRSGEVALEGFVYNHYTGESSDMKPYDPEIWALEIQRHHRPEVRLDIACRSTDGTNWNIVLMVDVKAQPSEYAI